MLDQGFETRSLAMTLMLLVTVQMPVADVERILSRVTEVAPLRTGAYDNNAYQSAAGFEWYRPLEGAAAGQESETRKRPGTVELTFELPDDRPLLERVIETIFESHSYQEPVIRVQPVLSSRSRGVDDSRNPNRWWNTTGDWKPSTPEAGRADMP